MDKPNDIFYKVEIRYQSEGDWIDETLYIIQKPVWIYTSEGHQPATVKDLAAWFLKERSRW